MADLAAICALRGLEHLPHPFFTRTWLWGISRQNESVQDRLADGDLHVFHGWVKAYAHADIWVECQAHYSSPDTPALRIAACRAGELGFLASQRPDEDIVDVFSVPPYEIGSAVAASVGLTTPGTHSRIVAPSFFAGLHRDSAGDHGDDYQVSFDRVDVRRPTATVPRSDVTAMAVIQSRCDPAREWGLGQGRKAVGWVRVRDDGEYIYNPDFSHATPVTPQTLGKRIDQLIIEDVAVLRQRRQANRLA